MLKKHKKIYFNKQEIFSTNVIHLNFLSFYETLTTGKNRNLDLAIKASQKYAPDLEHEVAFHYSRALVFYGKYVTENDQKYIFKSIETLSWLMKHIFGYYLKALLELDLKKLFQKNELYRDWQKAKLIYTLLFLELNRNNEKAFKELKLLIKINPLLKDPLLYLIALIKTKKLKKHFVSYYLNYLKINF